MPTEATSQFQLPCPKCGVQLLATPDQVGTLCACPACKREFTIPPAVGTDYAKRPAGTEPGQTSVGPERTYTFRCLRCSSTLQASSSQAGQPGKCPTCDASFTIPEYDVRRGRATGDADPGNDGENPTPMHAYAAAGQHAPRLIRQADDTLLIECPVCSARSAVASNNCANCGLPFTLEGATPQAEASGPIRVLLGLLLAGGIGVVALIAIFVLLFFIVTIL